MQKMMKMAVSILLLFIAVNASKSYAQNKNYDLEMRKLVESEKYSQAIKRGAEILAEDPKNAKIEYWLGMAYFNTAQYKAAKSTFQSGVNHLRREPLNYIGLGYCAVQDGNFEEAKRVLELAKDNNKSNSLEVALGRARAYMVSSKPQFLNEAELILVRMDSEKPNDKEILSALADLYDRQNILESALRNYRQVVDIDPEYTIGHARMGEILAKQGKYQEAITSLNLAIATDPAFAPPYKTMAGIRELAGKYYRNMEQKDQVAKQQFDLALENYEKYLELIGDDIYARINYANVLYLAEKYKKAIEVMEGIAGDTMVLAHKRLSAYSYVALEEAEQAEKYFDIFWKEAQKDPEIIISKDYECKAKIAELKGNYENAVEAFYKAFEYSKDKEKEAKPAYLLGAYEACKKDTNQMGQIEALEKYLAVTPSLTYTYQLAGIYQKVDSFSEADSLYGIIIKEREDFIPAYYQKAYNKFIWIKSSEDGNIEEATPGYEALLAAIGEEEENIRKYQAYYKAANSFLAVFYTNIAQDCEQAKKYWEGMLKVDPENEKAKQGLEACEEN